MNPELFEEGKEIVRDRLTVCETEGLIFKRMALISNFLTSV